MASAIIFSLHLIFIVFIFYIKKKNESISSAFQNLFLIIVLFAIGWDGISLAVLTIVEVIFYYKYYGKEMIATVSDKEKQ